MDATQIPVRAGTNAPRPHPSCPENVAIMTTQFVRTDRQATRLAVPTRQVVLRVLQAAVAAPSMHNTQPWRFRYRESDQTIELYADPSRMLRHADPQGRGVHIACGAAMFNLRLAIAVAERGTRRPAASARP